MQAKSALLHHAAQIHLGEAGRDLKQARRLRAFLNVAQFSAVRLAFPLHRKPQLGVEPEVADIAAGVCSLVFHRAAAVDGVAADLVAAATFVSHLLPVAASILDITRPEESGGISHAL